MPSSLSPRVVLSVLVSLAAARACFGQTAPAELNDLVTSDSGTKSTVAFCDRTRSVRTTARAARTEAALVSPPSTNSKSVIPCRESVCSLRAQCTGAQVTYLVPT